MLSIEAVTKKFDKVLLSEASMQVAYGQGVWLSGANGAGKSTLLRMVAGLVAPDQGKVLLDSKPVAIQRKRIAYCPSTSGSFYRRLSSRQNLHYFGSLFGLSARQVDSHIAASGELFEIDYWDRPAEGLSDGMLQKVKLVRAFLHNPDVVLLDEPLNFLDSAAKSKLTDWLASWVAANERRLFVVAQHSNTGAGLAWQLKQGRLSPL